MNKEDGLHQVAWEDYLQLNCVNHSALKRFSESPWHYQNPRKPKTSADFSFGTWFHALLMEPEIFVERYVPAPEGNKNSNAYKAAAQELSSGGKELIGAEDWGRLHNMREAVWNDPYAGPLFHEGQAEQTMIFSDPGTGMRCKGRIDWLPKNFPGVMVDLKTTKSAHPDSLRKSCWDYGYHTQEAFYRLGWDSLFSPLGGFLFVFVEKPNHPEDTPLPPQLYELDWDFRKKGVQQVRAWLDQLSHCHMQYGAHPWPHYTQGLTELSMPYWVKNKVENSQ